MNCFTRFVVRRLIRKARYCNRMAVRYKNLRDVVQMRYGVVNDWFDSQYIDYTNRRIKYMSEARRFHTYAGRRA